MKSLLRSASLLLCALAFAAAPLTSSAADANPPKDPAPKCTKCKDPSKCPAACCEKCNKK